MSRPQAFPQCLAARLARCRRSGNRRADMRPETRDLAGGHETLRQVEIEAAPMARPQGRQCLMSHPVSMSRCLNVSPGLLSQVSGLPLTPPATGTPLARLSPARPHRRSGTLAASRHRLPTVSLSPRAQAVLQCAPRARTNGPQTLRTRQRASKNAPATGTACERPALRASLSPRHSSLPSSLVTRHSRKRPEKGVRFALKLFSIFFPNPLARPDKM